MRATPTARQCDSSIATVHSFATLLPFCMHRYQLSLENILNTTVIVVTFGFALMMLCDFNHVGTQPAIWALQESLCTQAATLLFAFQNIVFVVSGRPTWCFAQLPFGSAVAFDVSVLTSDRAPVGRYCTDFRSTGGTLSPISCSSRTSTCASRSFRLPTKLRPLPQQL